MILLRFLQVEELQCCVVVSQLKEISTNKVCGGSDVPLPVGTVVGS
jgi:hypothetical protein